MKRKMDEKIRIWNKVITDILPDFENVVKNMNDENREENELRKLWVRGIPEKLRAKVWTRVTGNNNSITEGLFEIMAARGRKLRGILQEQTASLNEVERLSFEIEQAEKKIEEFKKAKEEAEEIKSEDEYDNLVKGLDDLK